jgi:phosphocarrier protein HPr
MQFVETANRYRSKIEVSKGALTVDAKSIMSMMRLAAGQGTVLRIVADGEDAEAAADILVNLVASGFGEE